MNATVRKSDTLDPEEKHLFALGQSQLKSEAAGNQLPAPYSKHDKLIILLPVVNMIS